jgi:hypothetical protein
MQNFLKDKVTQALDNQHKPLLLDQLSHRVITTLFHELFYSAEYLGRVLYVVYTSNSYPFGIPLGRLADAEWKEPTKANVDIRLGLISHRHPEMSYFVDACLHLNSHVSGKLVSGRQIQRLATKSALTFLRPWSQDALWVELYHTGLVPVVVGTLIAIEELLYQNRILRQTSMHDVYSFVIESRDKNFEAMRLINRPVVDYASNALITPEHQGCLPEDYMTIAVWY